MLLKPNELPTTAYEAKKIVCPLGLQIEKIHACPNDCILYRDENENLDECPICHASRYKILRDDPSNVEDEEHPKKRIPGKVMWYPPIIPRLK
jgi:Zn finger protein HypA/HybF involved in hydrogenase expression